MTDTQILTIVLSLSFAIVLPLSMLIYSNNSMEKRLNERIDNAFAHVELLFKSEHHKNEVGN